MDIECPHCFTFVRVRDDGLCPACCEDPNDTRGLDRDLVTVEIGEPSLIPDVCCSCGNTTRRSIRVQQWKPVGGPGSEATDDVETGVCILACHALFGWIGGIFLESLIKRSSHNRHTVSVPITQCEACSQAGPPQPLRVDFEFFTMRFVVHCRFRSRFDELVEAFERQ